MSDELAQRRRQPLGLAEAYDLALYVVSWLPEARIGAIGRFKPFDELHDSDPWGISLAIDGEARPKVLWSRADFDELMQARESAKRRDQVTAPASQHDESGIGQGLLF